MSKRTYLLAPASIFEGFYGANATGIFGVSFPPTTITILRDNIGISRVIHTFRILSIPGDTNIISPYRFTNIDAIGVYSFIE